MGEVLDAANKHAGTDRTKDETEEEKGKANVNNTGRNNGNNNNNNKRSHMDDGSDLVANANTGSGRPRSDENYRSNDNRGNNNGNNYNGGNRGPPRPTGHFDPMKMPCPRHSHDGKPANHSLENCTDLQRWKYHEV